MKITQLQFDWKEDITFEDIRKVADKLFGGDCKVYTFCQCEVDANVIFLCDETLEQDQLKLLWHIGDLATSEKEAWAGLTFADIIHDIKCYVAETS